MGELKRVSRELEIIAKSLAAGVVPHVTDDDLARSMHSLVKSGGAWKSDRQKNFILGKVRRGEKKLLDPTLQRTISSDDVGVIMTPMKEGTDGFKNGWAFVVDDQGVRLRLKMWAKEFFKTVKRNPQLEDAIADYHDDMGGRRHLIDPQHIRELKDTYKDAERYVNESEWKFGAKESWRRSS